MMRFPRFQQDPTVHELESLSGHKPPPEDKREPTMARDGYTVRGRRPVVPGVDPGDIMSNARADRMEEFNRSYPAPYDMED